MNTRAKKKRGKTAKRRLPRKRAKKAPKSSRRKLLMRRRNQLRGKSPKVEANFICASYSTGPDACFPRTDEGVRAMFAEGHRRGEMHGMPLVSWNQVHAIPNYLG